MSDVALNRAQSNPMQYRGDGLPSMEGTTIGWHEFLLYGTDAALFLKKLTIPLQGTLAAFAAYADEIIGRLIGTVSSIHEQQLLTFGCKFPYLSRITLRLLGLLHRENFVTSPYLGKLNHYSLRSQVLPIAESHRHIDIDNLPVYSVSPPPFT
ncbi:hypothetical protein DM872_14385 [Pseudomonas taiwanensis]|uniref:hypothetical protein n=1 Tax=Pseudomonas TaxID=286 RepID=UPI0015BC9E06|nr:MULTISPECIES: hypothetical protein [Pseudomonas]MDH4559711.1 MHS family MFS transporter [Pseudomonas sp. BN411]MDH4652981.1 MHS family MFS transporter [Pseudomonas sp. BN606]MDH4872548.1 MHS family MFS transporter [Pseudomonas sp. BN515]NWL78038.1 hypothetical protein [Pseudomonas taiwanensis]